MKSLDDYRELRGKDLYQPAVWQVERPLSTKERLKRLVIGALIP